jgi:hypothetical protein
MENRKSFRLYKPLIIICTLFLVIGILVFYVYGPKETEEQVVETNPDLIENGIHVRTGFIDADGLQVVVNNCTTCHSSKLVIQNRMGAEQWNATIRWMQKTQGLWDLGENQEIIVNYLVENYPPLEKGRRAPLTNIDWYTLEK